mmetsp:Transcript_19586/g.59249  ORF Transcript_19586/g.59249 Transcript_19586/m.59249 type:complete len:329 (-) Transcript_19586:347-1333(-)
MLGPPHGRSVLSGIPSETLSLRPKKTQRRQRKPRRRRPRRRSPAKKPPKTPPKTQPPRKLPRRQTRLALRTHLKMPQRIHPKMLPRTPPKKLARAVAEMAPKTGRGKTHRSRMAPLPWTQMRLTRLPKKPLTRKRPRMVRKGTRTRTKAPLTSPPSFQTRHRCCSSDAERTARCGAARPSAWTGCWTTRRKTARRALWSCPWPPRHCKKRWPPAMAPPWPTTCSPRGISPSRIRNAAGRRRTGREVRRGVIRRRGNSTARMPWWTEQTAQKRQPGLLPLLSRPAVAARPQLMVLPSPVVLAVPTTAEHRSRDRWRRQSQRPPRLLRGR